MLVTSVQCVFYCCGLIEEFSYYYKCILADVGVDVDTEVVLESVLLLGWETLTLLC